MKNNVRDYLRCLRKSKNILISLLIGSLSVWLNTCEQLLRVFLLNDAAWLTGRT